jgi:hypothetical protein
MTEYVQINFGDVVTLVDKKGNKWKYHGTIIAPEDDFARPKIKRGDKLLVFRQEEEESMGLDMLFGQGEQR